MTSREQNETKRVCSQCDGDGCAMCVPTPVPLEAREWWKRNQNEFLIEVQHGFGCATSKEFDFPKALESYSSHVNAALMEKLAKLEGFLKTANDNHEHFEREWYLAKDRAEAAESRISELERERDELLAMKLGGKFPQTRDEILTQSFCGVSGHFRFQQNGSSCLMCQRESRLVSKAKSQLSTTQEALRKIVQVSDELTGQTRLVDDIGFYEMNETLEEMTQIAERVLSPPTKLDG